MRVSIPEYFKTKTKIMGLTLRQLAVLAVFAPVCIVMAYLPSGLFTYLGISLIAVSLAMGTLYLLFEQFEIVPTPPKMILPFVFGTIIIFGITFLVPIATASTGFYVDVTHDIRIKTWGILFTAATATVFAFTDAIDFLKDFKIFRKAPRDAGWIDQSVRDLVPVEKVDNDLVYLKDGTIKSVYSVSPLSTDSLKEDQYKGIFRKYKEFLNSVNGEETQTSFQIVMRMADMSARLEEYFDRGRKRVSILAEKEDNKRLLQHFLALENMLMKMIKDNKPMVPRFYLVVNHDPLPFSSKIGAISSAPGTSLSRRNQEIRDINNTSQIISDKLQEAGLRDIKRLNTNELATLYRGFLTGLEVVDTNYMELITQATICTYCQTGRGHCHRCVEHGGNENLFMLEDEEDGDS